MPPKLLIATSNTGKQKEIRYLFRKVPADLVFPDNLGIDLQVEESGSTYFENAYLKASQYFKATGIPTLADDSGLEVDQLNGEPGIRSNRYAPLPNASDADRRQYLLSKLAPLPKPWQARFRCVIVIVDSSGSVHQFQGACRGKIIAEERGEGGFGYDRIFYIPGLNATMAELPEEIKNKISHRANAILAAQPELLSNLQNWL